MKFRTLAAFAAATALAAVAHAEGPLAARTSLSDVKAAAVKMKNVDGRELAIADVRGPAGTLVIFTCNHCPFVKAWEERTVALGNAYTAQGIGVIAVNANDPAVAGDTAEAMQERAKERKLAYPYVMDATSAVARAFGATRTPEFFLFDKDGLLAYHGALDDNAQKPEDVKENWLKSALESVVAGKPVAVAETKAIGCSIKFRKQS
jgi:peroxiredoxin